MLAEIKINANKILKRVGVISEETNAPTIVPGIDNNPSLNPIEYSILRCLAYEIDEAIALLKTANILLLAVNAGENPKNVSTGTMIIPPPKPIIEPKTPAANPNGINHNSSIMIRFNRKYYFYIVFSRV